MLSKKLFSLFNLTLKCHTRPRHTSKSKRWTDLRSKWLSQFAGPAPNSQGYLLATENHSSSSGWPQRCGQPTEGTHWPIWPVLYRDIANIRISRKGKLKLVQKSGLWMKSAFQFTRKCVPLHFISVYKAWQMQSVDKLIADESHLGVVAKT